MSNVLIDLEKRLAGLSVTTPAPVFLARMPDQPDRLICIREYQPDPPKDLDGGGWPALEPRSVQLIARVEANIGAKEAQDLADAAARWIVGRHFEVGDEPTEHYDWVLPNHMPFLIGFDENDRPLAVVNLRIQRWGDVSSSGRQVSEP